MILEILINGITVPTHFDTVIISNNMTSPSPDCYTTIRSMTIKSDILDRTDITLAHDLVTELDLFPQFDLFTELQGVSIEHLQQVLHADRWPSFGCWMSSVHRYFSFRFNCRHYRNFNLIWVSMKQATGMPWPSNCALML